MCRVHAPQDPDQCQDCSTVPYCTPSPCQAQHLLNAKVPAFTYTLAMYMCVAYFNLPRPERLEISKPLGETRVTWRFFSKSCNSAALVPAPDMAHSR